MSKALIPGPPGRIEILTRERTYITEQLNDSAVPGVSLAQARVEPGVTTELHVLSVAEWYVIGSGYGLMEVGGAAPFEVAAGESVEIPAGVSQRITNSGDQDLLLQCICIPRFTSDSYTSLE